MRVNKVERKKEKAFLRALPYKHYLVYCVGCETGLRISDILEIKHADLVLKEFSVIERKTGKKRKVRISAALRRELMRYVGESCGKKYVFYSSRSKTGHITRQAVYRAFKNAAKYAGIKGNIGTHSMRKRYAGDLLRKGEDLLKVQKALNHSHLSDTMLYLMDDIQELREDREKAKFKNEIEEKKANLRK